MAYIHYAEAADEVEVRPACSIVQVHTIGPHYFQPDGGGACLGYVLQKKLAVGHDEQRWVIWRWQKLPVFNPNLELEA
jgi:hypothetical protein